MIHHWPAILGGLGLLFWAGSSQAASVPPAITTEGTAIIDKVHGTHRACRYSPATGWWHRHVGRYNRAVSCDSYSYDSYDEPFYFGPFFFEPYRYRERRTTPRFRERRIVPRFRDGGRFDRPRFERSRPRRGGSGRRR
jgi:hypothetical protein